MRTQHAVTFVLFSGLASIAFAGAAQSPLPSPAGPVTLVPKGTTLPYPRVGHFAVHEGLVVPGDIASGESCDLRVELVATTSLRGDVFKHRMRLLAGNAWELRDVRAG